MKCRPGIMLLEVGVAITASAALLYGAVFIFSSFQRIDRTARQRVQISRELVRLAEQFRSDVHAARDVEPEEAAGADAASVKSLLRLSGPENVRVVYAVGDHRQLVRTLADAEKVVKRDVFDLGPGADYSIDLRHDRVSQVTLVVALSQDADSESKRPKNQRRITALLSRDHGHAGMQKHGE